MIDIEHVSLKACVEDLANGLQQPRVIMWRN